MRNSLRQSTRIIGNFHPFWAYDVANIVKHACKSNLLGINPNDLILNPYFIDKKIEWSRFKAYVPNL